MNPFSKLDPPPSRLNELFVGREAELRRAARAVAKARKVLLLGGYGSGKTTFAKKLLYELGASRKLRFITGYAALSSATPEGFQLAALVALSRAVLASSLPLSPAAEEARKTIAEISAIQSVPGSLVELRFQDLLALARASVDDRVVLVIDELDKTDSAGVRNVLAGARPILDLPQVSFIVVARPFEIFADASSSVNAPFDERLTLGLFAADATRDIVRKNLELARVSTVEADPFAPFSRELVDVLVSESRSLPRPLNMMVWRNRDRFDRRRDDSAIPRR